MHVRIGKLLVHYLSILWNFSVSSRSDLLDAMGDKIPGIKSLGQIPALSSLDKELYQSVKVALLGTSTYTHLCLTFYFTCAVTKASSTMAKCVELFTQGPNGALNPANTVNKKLLKCLFLLL